MGDVTLIAKVITCEVSHVNKKAFHESQKSWNKLIGIEGFIRQEGGWVNIGTYNIAVIIAFWLSKEKYMEFMKNEHDLIFHKSNQQNLYENIDVSIIEVEDANLEKCNLQLITMTFAKTTKNNKVIVNKEQIQVFLKDYNDSQQLIKLENDWHVL
jgi:hypothetical protein